MAMVRLRSGVVFALLLPMMGIGLADQPDEAGASELKSLSLEQLMNVEVTSVSKKPEKLMETPAAVYVITSEDIHRSGVRSIPEALRMAPGMEVARVDSNKWAIGTRGFTSRLSRSMLALMDGRSLYTPLFAGVYWEVQDTLLEDIDRIEVIRGPGGTLWGANAVNGVINIVTKNAKDTQGVRVSGGGGSEELGFGSVRYGGKLGEATSYRIYGKYFTRDAGFSRNAPNFDGWDMGRAGFRTDTDLGVNDSVTVQGDLYEGTTGQRATMLTTLTRPFQERVQKDSDLSGGNLLGRWKHQTSEDSEFTLQAYYDQTFRRETALRDQQNTYDVDFQHRFRLPLRQEMVWGLGYRLAANDTGGGGLTIRFVPASRDLQLFSGFVQDEVVLVEDLLRLTIGSKLEHNDFSGFEIQPSARLLWTPATRHFVWVSFTRAVRTPSRIERDFGATVVLEPQTPTFAELIGDGGFEPEKVHAFELGYRIEPFEWLFVDVASFYSRYLDLLSLEPGAPSRASNPDRVVVPFLIRNRLDGEIYGAELSTNATIFDWWRAGATYSFLELSLEKESGSQDPSTVESTEGSSPHHQVALRSMMDLPGRTEFDGWVRYVDNLPAQKVGSYVTLDLRLGWHPTDAFEVSVVGQNLAQNHHPEFGGGAAGIVEVERSVYGRATWRW